jgi:dephospho-CoA kinase
MNGTMAIHESRLTNLQSPISSLKSLISNSRLERMLRPTTFRVVLTGGIASGKTAVANEFAKLGVPVIDTDQVARDVVVPGTPALMQIVEAFGPQVLGANGQLDRRRMRELVFADPVQRAKLEAITHPAIRAELARRSQEVHGTYQIHAIPLYVETGAKGGYDRVLVVDCPEPIQIDRLMQRDGIDETQARRALAAQATREQRLAAANDVIENTSALDALCERVAQLHRQYLKLARSRVA